MQEKYDKKVKKNTVTPYKMQIYRRITDYIKSKKTTITKKELGMKVGYSDTGIHRAIVDGTMSLGVFIDICQALNVNPGHFFKDVYDQDHGEILHHEERSASVSKHEYEEMQNRLMLQIDRLTESINNLTSGRADTGESSGYSKRQTAG